MNYVMPEDASHERKAASVRCQEEASSRDGPTSRITARASLPSREGESAAERRAQSGVLAQLAARLAHALVEPGGETIVVEFFDIDLSRSVLPHHYRVPLWVPRSVA